MDPFPLRFPRRGRVARDRRPRRRAAARSGTAIVYFATREGDTARPSSFRRGAILWRRSRSMTNHGGPGLGDGRISVQVDTGADRVLEPKVASSARK
ncbi:MAG: hypothetical protein MZV70_52985 [Desulfobacterales bacterium]|nr:hypothetical protein [Desulfobacterales bacterium]